MNVKDKIRLIRKEVVVEVIDYLLLSLWGSQNRFTTRRRYHDWSRWKPWKGFLPSSVARRRRSSRYKNAKLILFGLLTWAETTACHLHAGIWWRKVLCEWGLIWCASKSLSTNHVTKLAHRILACVDQANATFKVLRVGESLMVWCTN